MRSRTVEVTTMAGAVLRCQPVPPFAQADVRSRLPEPPYPKVDVKSATGGTEAHPAMPGTEEHEEYRLAMQRYRRELALALSKFYMNYGIVEWHLPEEAEDEPWHSMPPDDWEIPQAMRLYGIETASDPADRRAQYIQYELILTDADQDMVDQVHTPTMPLTKEEILAALAPFGSDQAVDLSIILRAVRQA